MAELHLHGGPAVLAGACDALASMPRLRPAEPGEFARRAFANGKFDLSEVEGLADLIAAETAAQRRQALRQMEGALSVKVEAWRERLLRSMAYLEAAIDFTEEELPRDVESRIWPDVEALGEEIAVALNDGGRAERLRAGLSIAIVGPPNVGKSSLLNALARREVAIVSETAGTTRDVIEVHLDLGGYPVTLADTAGLRELAEAEGQTGIEAEGIRRAAARAAQADLKVAVFDARDAGDPDRATLKLLDKDSLVVLNKVDLGSPAAAPKLEGRQFVAVSARTGQGMDRLIARLAEVAEAYMSAPNEAPAITRARHRTALREAAEAMGRAKASGAIELAAEDLRLAARALGRVAGRVDVEDLLDVIFRDFCIGK